MTPPSEKFTTEEILAILDFVAALDWEVFELQTEGLTLYVSKTEPQRAREPGQPQAQHSEVTGNPSKIAVVQPAAAAPVEGRGDDQEARPPDQVSGAATDGQHIITAPMVGTFYRAPEPGASPYVEIGSMVRVNDTLCLLEVMKLFNTIAADVSGRVTAIHVRDGELVEYGQPLFALDLSEDGHE